MPRAKPGPLDVVYPFRDRGSEELRYSLRSLGNLRHRKVWLVGDRPEWATGLEHLATVHEGSKYADSTRNVLTACLDERLTDDVILMNDDFFVMSPTPSLEPMHRGPVRDVMRRYPRSPYGLGMRATAALLAKLGHDDPLSYELHLPMVVNRAAMVEVLRVGLEARIDGLNKRTLYGVLTGMGGRRVEDVKVYSARMPEGLSWWPFVSTSNVSFGHHPIGRFVRDAFPRPSRYEVPVEAAA